MHDQFLGICFLKKGCFAKKSTNFYFSVLAQMNVFLYLQYSSVLSCFSCDDDPQQSGKTQKKSTLSCTEAGAMTHKHTFAHLLLTKMWKFSSSAQWNFIPSIFISSRNQQVALKTAQNFDKFWMFFKEMLKKHLQIFIVNNWGSIEYLANIPLCHVQ